MTTFMTQTELDAWSKLNDVFDVVSSICSDGDILNESEELSDGFPRTVEYMVELEDSGDKTFYAHYEYDCDAGITYADAIIVERMRAIVCGLTDDNWTVEHKTTPKGRLVKTFRCDHGDSSIRSVYRSLKQARDAHENGHPEKYAERIFEKSFISPKILV